MTLLELAKGEEVREAEYRKLYPRSFPIQFGKATKNGRIQCPHCQQNMKSPVRYNPYTNRWEKMFINAYVQDACHHCGTTYVVTYLQAYLHNAYWYPSDPETQRALEDLKRT